MQQRPEVSEGAVQRELADLDGWARLLETLDEVTDCLADLRSPLPERFERLGRVMQGLEAESLKVIPQMVAWRNAEFPDAATWRLEALRYPQPEPTLVLALREWIWSLSSEPSIPLSRQKRLNKVLTEILVARAALQTYSNQLCDNRPQALVRLLNAVWVLVAQTWKARPLLAGGANGNDDRSTEDDS